METNQIIILCLAVALGVAVLVNLGLVIVLVKIRAAQQHGKIKVKDGVRYASGKTPINFYPNDILLSQEQTYTVAQNGSLKPGQYTVILADTSTKGVNLKINGVVKQYRDQDGLVLAAGDTVVPRSGNVILR